MNLTARSRPLPATDVVSSAPGAAIAAHPGMQPWRWTIPLVMLLFALAWLTMLDATTLTPPVDNLEQLTWVRALQWGYYKHPPLPTFLLWLPVFLFGLSGWITYILGAAVTLSALAVLWRFLCAVRGKAYASVALLAVLCITFYNGRLYYYNHNVVLMWFVVASATCCWQAFATRRMRWWCALGAALGLGALAKYQIALTALCVVFFWCSQRGWSDPLHRRGLLLATLVALLILLPHLLWLRDHGYAPVDYAMETSLGAHLAMARRIGNATQWIADQVLNRAAPALLLLVLAARAAPRREAVEATAATGRGAPASRTLLRCWAIVPLVSMPVLGLLSGTELQLQWGTAFLPFLVPCVMDACTTVAWENVQETAVLKGFAFLQAVLLLINFATSVHGVKSLQDHHWRNFPSASLAASLRAAMQSAGGRSVRILVGDPRIAAALALRLPDRPLVLIDGRYDRSPWVTADLVARCGAVELLQSAVPPAHASRLSASVPGLYWRRIAPTAAAADACPTE